MGLTMYFIRGNAVFKRRSQGTIRNRKSQAPLGKTWDWVWLVSIGAPIFVLYTFGRSARRNSLRPGPPFSPLCSGGGTISLLSAAALPASLFTAGTGVAPKTITDLPDHDPAPLHYFEQSSELQADWTAESKSDGANAHDGDVHLHPWQKPRTRKGKTRLKRWWKASNIGYSYFIISFLRYFLV